MQRMRKQVILEFKPFNVILEYGQSNVLFDLKFHLAYPCC